MKSIRLFSIAVALFGFTAVSQAQTLQDVVEARNKGSELMAAGDLDGAIAELEKCVDLAKKVGGDDAEDHQIIAEGALPGLYWRKARQLRDGGDLPATLQALEATVAAAEKYNDPAVKETAEKTIPSIYQALGAAAVKDSSYEDAIKNFDLALARDPNIASLYFSKGACYWNLKDEAKMEENYKLAIEKGTANNDANTVQRAKRAFVGYFNAAGVAAQKTQKWDDAIAAFSKTVEIDNENIDAYYSLVVSYNNKKNWDNAITNAERALELGDTRTDALYYQLGTAYQGKNNNAQACEYFKKVTGGSALAGAKYQIEHVLKCK